MQIQQKEVDFAVKLALTGGKNTLKYFKKDILVSQKSDKSPVTEADKELSLIHISEPTRH